MAVNLYLSFSFFFFWLANHSVNVTRSFRELIIEWWTVNNTARWHGYGQRRFRQCSDHWFWVEACLGKCLQVTDNKKSLLMSKTLSQNCRSHCITCFFSQVLKAFCYIRFWFCSEWKPNWWWGNVLLWTDLKAKYSKYRLPETGLQIKATVTLYWLFSFLFLFFFTF